MEYQLYVIGMLINDLRKGRAIETDGIEEDIREVFIEMLKPLAYAWLQKVEWMDYLLDFHSAEAIRLKKYVKPKAKDYQSLRVCIHQELTLLIERLDMMINAENYVDLEDLMRE
ncbi:MAG: hypothetical protein EOP48_11515 [Sphingobacteriales bacterium]|nr:MAG: hypothetical protein EOP48_11515 [Sphingobacteriales bacterium]